MRNTLFVLLSGVLILSAAFAQESGSVEDILKELAELASGPLPTKAATVPTDAATESVDAGVEPSVASASAEATADKEDAPDAEAAAEPAVDVETVVEESRALYVNGEFERAQAGFEAIVKKEPENGIAQLYLRKILERDQRSVEVSGMKAVDAAWCTGMALRSYAVSSDAAEKMGLGGAEASVEVSAKFPEVDFPKGASAVYQPRLEKLFVRNTRDNLLVLEEILDAMDVAKLSADVEQVEIEAKFVEVSEGTLEELGFEWRGDGNPIDLFGDVQTGGTDFLFDDALRGGASGPPMPFSRPDLMGAGSDGASGNWSAFRFEDTFAVSPDTLRLHHDGHVPLDVVISALDQSSGADVLSAPRIVTKSGETAIIRVGELHTYPEIYEASASAGNIVHVKYEDWEETLLGVELEVTPQVDGDQIELGLNPKFRELQGWQNYDIAQANSAYTHVQEDIGMTYLHAPIVAQLPFYRVREIDTEVTIADGATIVMGGLTSEKVEAFEDKVPVLGSLPLVGRLFRNEGERAIKRNLMMFVTAKIVEPTGRISSSRSFE